MKRILLVIDQIRTGGAEKILLDFRQYLQSNGYDVEVFTMYYSCSKYNYGCKNNAHNIILKFFQQIYVYIKLRLYVRGQQPDSIFSFLDRSNVIVSLLPAKYKRCLSVHNVLSVQYEKVSPLLLKFVKRLIASVYNRKCNIIIAVSLQVKNDLVENFAIKRDIIKVITNCTNKSYITQKALEQIDEILLEKDCKYLLNIGRLSTQKAQWKLLKSLKYLKDNYTECNIRLIILGEGELRDPLILLSHKLGLSDIVSILPFNCNPFKFIKSVDLFVLPSIFEGCPIVLSEVIALETPFVGSQRAVPIELFSDNMDAWKNITFCNKNHIPDFSDSILSDDIELAELIKKHLFDNNSVNSVTGCMNWNRFNDKKHQFDSYLQLLR